GVEVVAPWIFDVHENRVVLSGPAPFRPRAVVVGPHDLVQEAVAPEDFVQRDLDVVRLPGIEMDVQRSALREQLARLAQEGLEPADVVIEGVDERRLAHLLRAVAAALEAGAVAVLVRDGAKRAAALFATGVEGRVD